MLVKLQPVWARAKPTGFTTATPLRRFSVRAQPSLSSKLLIEEHSRGPNDAAQVESIISRVQKHVGSSPSKGKMKISLEDVTDAEKIFPTSRDLNLNDMQAFGFDYDYTIANYNEEIQPLIYSLTCKHLVDVIGYPKEISHFAYDPNFAIRGLHYDQKNGNLIKLDYLFNLTPGYVYFGRRPLTKQQIEDQYHGFHLSPAAQANLRPLMDQFCLPEACLIADLLQHFENKGISFDPSYVYSDVYRALSWVHTSGTLHRAIMENVPRFLQRQRGKFLGKFLARLREAGKKVFLLTNSPYNFVHSGLTYLLESEQWVQQFDYVMLQSGKPDFFLNTRRPFRMLDKHGGSGRHHIRWDKISEFEPGQIYVEGNLAEFHNLTQLRGSQVVYFGDHLFTDLREPSRISGWRTAVIIEELEHEVRTQNTQLYRDTLRQQLLLEENLRKLYLVRTKKSSNDSDDVDADVSSAASLETLAAEVETAISQKRKLTKQMFNTYFGSVFRTHTNATIFAYMLQRYADIYTSKLENFDFYPLDFVHHAEREFLPHERTVKWEMMRSLGQNWHNQEQHSLKIK